MRGVATENRFGLMPNFLLNHLLEPERVRENLQNEFPTLFVLKFVKLIDIFRERIAKPTYRSLPLNFRIWYDRARYRV
jgi:hypothetical protein